MDIDERLVRKGKPEPREGLIQQGKTHIKLAKEHAAALAENGWSAGDTDALLAGVTALEGSLKTQSDAMLASGNATKAEHAGVDGTKQFIRKLRNALPRALREATSAGVTMSAFSPDDNLGRSTPKISAYLTKIRPAVERLDQHFVAVNAFNGKKGTEVLDAVQAKLDTADADQELALKNVPLQTLKLYETKGLVLEKIEDLNRSGKNAFDGQAHMVALFNKDILLRARKERAAKEDAEAGGGGGEGSGGAAESDGGKGSATGGDGAAGSGSGGEGSG